MRPTRSLPLVSLAAVVALAGCQSSGRGTTPTTTAPSSSTPAPSPPPATTPSTTTATPTSPRGTPTPIPTSSNAQAWQPTTLRKFAATSFAVDPRTPAIVYAASSTGVDQSTDGGATWAPVFTTATNAVAVDPTGTTVYAGTASGVSMSQDRGVTWSSTPASANVSALAIDPTTPTTVFAGTTTGAILRSIDAGATWTTLTTGITTVVASLAIDPSAGANIYAATGGTGSLGQFAQSPGPGPGGLSKSTDGGATWVDLKNGFSSVFNVVAVDPVTPTTIYGGSYAVLNPTTFASIGLIVKSTDGGATWAQLTSFPSAHIYGLALDPKTSGTIYTCGLGGVLKSTDGGASWANAGNGLMPRNSGGIPESWAIAIDPTAPLTLYASSVSGVQGVYKTTTGGQ